MSSMLSMSWEPLPARVAVTILVLAALAQIFAWRVPNILTLPALLAGWVYALYVSVSGGSPQYALLSSLLGAAVTLLIMLPAYIRRGLGAGCIKAQMAFAAWLGAAVPLVPALTVIASVTLVGLAVSFALLYLTAADVPDDEQQAYEYPAQVATTLVALIGTLALWLLSSPV